MALAVAGCTASLTDSSCPGESCRVDLAVRLDLSGVPAVDKVVIEVSGPTVTTPLVFNLTIAAGVASGTVTVPAGSGLTVTVTAFDAAGIRTHRGSTVVDVREGDNPAVVIILHPLQGRQPIEARIGTLLVSVAPKTGRLAPGDTLRLSATVTDALNQVLAVTVRWATLNPALAWVDTAGLVTARAPGRVAVVATYAGVGDAAELTIGPAPSNAASLRFDGASQYAETPDAADLDLFDRVDYRGVGQALERRRRVSASALQMGYRA